MNTCGLCEHHETEGYLCPGCTLATAHRLDSAPRWHEALGAFLQPAPAPLGGAGRGGRAEASLPVTEPVLTLRGPGGIVGVLEDWRAAMQADRGWDTPVITGTIGRRITTAARALSINLDWITASWPAAGAMAEEIRGLERDVRSIIIPTDPADRPVRTGLCPASTADGTLCGAVLLRYPSTSTITCRWCGATWPPTRLLQLARAQQELSESHALATTE
ncbi:hypothetical protein [Streptomyces sp. NPDC058045]|uniref:hypothetical protein n=1 Tax=Streptomyces sp. NPDC058045 TaxID=3346311 RepID=UPI0036E0AE90